MKNLRLTTVQSDLFWEDVPANLEMFSAKLEYLKGRTEIVVLPEMFTTGFSMNVEKFAEDMEGQTMNWMTHQSRKLGAVIIGSFIAEENGNFYNRLVWMQPDGQFHTYDKRHLFTLLGEEKQFTAGDEKLVVEWKGWKVCPLICYDLRFPVWSRNTEDYDLLIYIANWPEKRHLHWKTLLRARAIENQCFTVGVNRIGKDGNGNNHEGDTAVIDYSGVVQYRVAGMEDMFTAKFTKTDLEKFRQQLNFLPDQDKFQVLPE